MNKLLKNKKLFFGVIGTAVAVVAGVIALAMWPKKEGYRTIQIYKLDGRAEVNRQNQGTIEPYVNMMLQSGDEVKTYEESYLYLKMDEDKFLLAEPLTRFRLEATGTARNSQTKIELDEGAVVNHITEPLSKESSYEVKSPNSTMAVRGTSFRVYVWYDENGVSHTVLEVFEGIVSVKLIYPDGSESGESRQFRAGQTAFIWGNSETSDYDYVEDTIDYYELDIPTLEFLKIAIDELKNYNITIPDVDEIIRLKQTYFDVIFKVGEEEFGRQSVLFDHTAHEPAFRPTLAGRWDFDFETAIRGETEIQWIEE